MHFSSGSLFLRELMVIITGAFFSDFSSPKTLHKVEGVLGGVWVFGQIVLFSMLGSKTKPHIFEKLPDILPLIFVGLAFRLVGNTLTMLITIKLRPKSSLSTSILFCFLSCLPRATIQGALGQIPLAQKFWRGEHDWEGIEGFIGTASKIYIVTLAVFGMVMLNTFGPRLLENDTGYEEVDKGHDSPETFHLAPSQKNPMEALAQELNIDLKHLKDSLAACEVQLKEPAPQQRQISPARKFQSIAHAVHQFDNIHADESVASNLGGKHASFAKAQSF
jgi:hypothetical protein